jgi:hypothetical protein
VIEGGGGPLGFKNAAPVFVLVVLTFLALPSFWLGSFLVGGLLELAPGENASLLYHLTVFLVLIFPIIAVIGPLTGWLNAELNEGVRLMWAGAHIVYLPVALGAMVVLAPLFRA